MDIVIYMKINIFKHTFLLFWAKCLHLKNKNKKNVKDHTPCMIKLG